ncbi:hypothetical protein SAMD00019534_072250 [Acytostelium subglobosum LB1]|uniref:hypothetical protein n=1 Tax=Acytostelium subglobosum LB1 TaxID=1410327 RepID=UPI0006448CB9|nr:hypothetical protein SAMD00019534_072250 [Acytostelium subglobosum LB1]GAM24050.1 hypothetical protein SAMD00019534_072250 [Acytostelium subglobosum LB1]|eukprot:XP_012753086.1 hypothetical protein SAMD00019534_072250 [Acytostelium subglobosum LB1]
MFLCKGETELPMPRIEVKDVGLLSYPVPPVQIQSMIERATRAPFGKGTETITDLNVRRVWQIQNKYINITGKHYQTYFNSITKSIKESMGLTNEVVTAELYKLLVYDKGSFFLPHRDSEKADNMFGTLVLSLPCPHRGGDLVVNHSGRDEVVSLENDSMSAIKWTAFFADCQHEVKPVTEGCRVCLVYNLLRSGGTNVDINVDSESITQAFNQVFGRFTKKPSHIPEKLVYTLEHVYSLSNFTLESLKGSDATLARTLQAFSNEAQIRLGLAFLLITEEGIYEYDEDPSSTTIILNDVKDLETGTILEKNMPLDNGEIMPDRCLDKIKPYSKEAQEATGNEGASYDRLYRRSAIVIWSTETLGKFTMVLSKEHAFDTLEKELSKLGGVDANPQSTHDLFIQMTKSLYRVRPTSEFVSKMLELLCSIKSDQYLPKMMLAMLETTGSLYQTGMHQDAFMELLLKRPSMNHENIDSVMSFASVVPVGDGMDMLIKLLDIINHTPQMRSTTLFPKMAQQLIKRLNNVQQCDTLISIIQQQKVFDGQRQQLLDKLIVVAQGHLMPDHQKIRWTRDSIKDTEVTLATLITNIESLFKTLGEGQAPIYINESFLGQMYKKIFDDIKTWRSLDIECLLPALPIINRINLVYPYLVMENNDYDSMLKNLIEYKYKYDMTDDNLAANKLYSIWKLVRGNDSLLTAFVNNICGLKKPTSMYDTDKPIEFPSGTLILLLGHLYPEFVSTTQYISLWDHVTKENLHKTMKKPDIDDPSIEVKWHCSCVSCSKVTDFLRSMDTSLKMTVSKFLDQKNVMIMVDRFKLDKKILKDSNEEEEEEDDGDGATTILLTKSNDFQQLKLNIYNDAINICHSLFQIRPANSDYLLTSVINKFPAPEVYPHTLAKIITIPEPPNEVKSEDDDDYDDDDDEVGEDEVD